MRSPLLHTGTPADIVRHALAESTAVVLESSDEQEEQSLLLRLQQINETVVGNLTSAVAMAFRHGALPLSEELAVARTVKDDAAATAYVRGFEEGADATRTRSLMEIGYVRHRLTLVLGIIAELQECDVTHEIHAWLGHDFTIRFTGSAEDY